jgi:hypothetical protein
MLMDVNGIFMDFPLSMGVNHPASGVPFVETMATKRSKSSRLHCTGPQSLISALGNFSTSVADHGFVNAALAHMATYNLGTERTVWTQCEIAYIADEI